MAISAHAIGQFHVPAGQKRNGMYMISPMVSRIDHRMNPRVTLGLLGDSFSFIASPFGFHRLTVCVTGRWAGVDNAWEQEKLEARKMLENATESTASNAR